jgi:hypothetical protein
LQMAKNKWENREKGQKNQIFRQFCHKKIFNTNYFLFKKKSFFQKKSGHKILLKSKKISKKFTKKQFKTNVKPIFCRFFGGFLALFFEFFYQKSMHFFIKKLQFLWIKGSIWCMYRAICTLYSVCYKIIRIFMHSFTLPN